VEKRVYAIRNVDARAKTLIIEHPVKYGVKLVDTVKSIETASNVYRFEVKVPASGSIDFSVTEENVRDEQTAISSITPDALLVYVQNKAIAEPARRQLQQINDLKTQIAALDSERRTIETNVQNVARDEE